MERFFSHRQDGERCERVEADVGMGSSDVGMLLLHGPPRCGKSSLALQLAYELVKRGGPEASVVLVLHASTKNNRHRVVPVESCDSCGTPARSGQDMVIWQRVRIKFVLVNKALKFNRIRYLENVSQLRHFACSFHMIEGQNTALIVDDLDLFCTTPEHIYRCLAFIKETMEFMRTKHGAGQVLVVASSMTLPRDLRRTLRRWFDLILQVTPGSPAPPFAYSLARGANETFEVREEAWPSAADGDWAELRPLFPPTYRVEYAFAPDGPDRQGHLQFRRAS
ncbi:hypothetical protein ACHHYP_02969 [Achlya hypogyna]|uniref:AAA+ ATPase domain-containing protein n=1 Tax=Achlya hypogyna TaxID=1202772 RepID=A0A1V9Z547_ACHHY|nr:hypothetical protein ACHHYP_02969 [Achlya hypogyna]